jgi:hypothetical protein
MRKKKQDPEFIARKLAEGINPAIPFQWQERFDVAFDNLAVDVETMDPRWLSQLF